MTEITKKKWHARTKPELIIEVWEYLDCDSVGAVELEEIQHVIGENYGQGAVDSPASIARILAAEGAVLRHPEIIECDALWRERSISRLINVDELDFSTLRAASISIGKIEAIRKRLQEVGNHADIKVLRQQVLEYKQDAHLIESSKIASDVERGTAGEIVLWLGIWLQQPDLFHDWLDLRISSPEFLKTFESLSLS